MPCDGPRMNPSVDVGNPPRPFRHLRMTERRTPDPSSSRVPVHSALVQKSVTAITNLVGRLSTWMLGKTRRMRKSKPRKRWQAACNQSNRAENSKLAMPPGLHGLLPESRAESGPHSELRSATVIHILQFPFSVLSRIVEAPNAAFGHPFRWFTSPPLRAPNSWSGPKPLQTSVPGVAPEAGAIQDADSSAQCLGDIGCVNDW
jgi:hypothetical protein